jgi:PKD repeat protein
VTGSKKLTYKFTDSGEYTVTYAAANAAGTVKAQETVTVFSSSVDIDDGNTAPSENYCDISGHWAEDDILSAYENGIFDGGLMFYPESTVSRATFVTVLGKLYEHMGGVIPDMTETDFSDVTASQWYARYVAWAAENGIATGSDGVFDPDGSIQRQQIAAMICRFEDAFGITVKAVNESVDFADADEISDYAREYVARMYVSGIMTGRSGNTFSPESSVTKAEIAVIITRLMEAE